MEFTKQIIGLDYLNSVFTLQEDAHRRAGDRMLLTMVQEPAESDEDLA